MKADNKTVLKGERGCENSCQIAKSRRKENGLGTSICLAWLHSHDLHDSLAPLT